MKRLFKTKLPKFCLFQFKNKIGQLFDYYLTETQPGIDCDLSSTSFHNHFTQRCQTLYHCHRLNCHLEFIQIQSASIKPRAKWYHTAKNTKPNRTALPQR